MNLKVLSGSSNYTEIDHSRGELQTLGADAESVPGVCFPVQGSPRGSLRHKYLVKYLQVKYSGAKSILWNSGTGVLVGAPMQTGAELLTSRLPPPSGVGHSTTVQ